MSKKTVKLTDLDVEESLLNWYDEVESGNNEDSDEDEDSPIDEEFEKTIVHCGEILKGKNDFSWSLQKFAKR